MLDQPVVDPASRLLLPPPGAVLRAALPAAPPVTDALTELSATVTVSRPEGEIAGNFAGVPEVRQASSTIPPADPGEPATLTGFAAALAQAYGGQLWLGTAVGAGAGRAAAVRGAVRRPGRPAAGAMRSGGSAWAAGGPSSACRRCRTA